MIEAGENSDEKRQIQVSSETTIQDRLLLAMVCLMGGVALGMLVTIPSALLAIATAGVGHGDYLFARLLFPYSLLLTRFTGHAITTPLIMLALGQMPFYGAVVGVAFPWKQFRAGVAFGLLVVHLAAVGAGFGG